MRELKLEEVKQLSAGTAGLSLIIDVPSAQTQVLTELLSQYFLGTLTANSLAFALVSQPMEFNAMQVKAIDFFPHPS